MACDGIKHSDTSNEESTTLGESEMSDGNIDSINGNNGTLSSTASGDDGGSYKLMTLSWSLIEGLSCVLLFWD